MFIAGGHVNLVINDGPYGGIFLDADDARELALRLQEVAGWAKEFRPPAPPAGTQPPFAQRRGLGVDYVSARRAPPLPGRTKTPCLRSFLVMRPA